MKKDWKRWGSLVFLCTLLFFCGCQGKESGEGFLEEQNAPGLTVTFFNVGKGDAILIEAAMTIPPGKSLVIWRSRVSGVWTIW